MTTKCKLICIICLSSFIIGVAAAKARPLSSTKKHHSVHTIGPNYKSAYHVFGKHYAVLRSSHNYREKGIASWYGKAFHRKYTSSGERYNMYKLTAAHKSLPLSTRVQVTNLKNGRQVIVKVNDRGPFISNRLIDLSYGAAKKLGMVGMGLAPVVVKALS